MTATGENVLTFVGDVFMPEPLMESCDLPGTIVFNLEGPITSCDAGVPGKINLRSQTNHVRSAFGGAPLVACLANNHILDFGAQGALDTLSELGRAGISWFGMTAPGRDSQGLLLTINGTRVGLLGYVDGSTHPVCKAGPQIRVPLFSIDELAHDIRELRALGTDVIVVSIHWGVEELALPKLEDVSLGRAVIDTGANLVIGHHAHRIQPFVEHDHRSIFFGLGNCVMPDLCVQSHFEGGSPTRVFRKRQSQRNRRSLAVTWDPKRQSVEVDELMFDGRRLRRCRPWSRRLPSISQRRAYRCRWYCHYVTNRLCAVATRFAARPRVPRLRHLKGLVRVLLCLEAK